MNYSNDQRHAATITLLGETLEFLLRMPNVPVTRELCNKVQAHLEDPTNTLIEQEAKLVGNGAIREGGLFTPAGIPTVLAHLVEPGHLTVWSPKLGSRTAQEANSNHIMKMLLNGGAKLSLRPKVVWDGPKYGGAGARS